MNLFVYEVAVYPSGSSRSLAEVAGAWEDAWKAPPARVPRRSAGLQLRGLCNLWKKAATSFLPHLSPPPFSLPHPAQWELRGRWDVTVLETESAALPLRQLLCPRAYCVAGRTPAGAGRPTPRPRSQGTQATGCSGSLWSTPQVWSNLARAHVPDRRFVLGFSTVGSRWSPPVSPGLTDWSVSAGTVKTKTFLATMIFCFPRRTSAVLIQ